MRYRYLGNTATKASVVGLGTWAIGGWMWGGTDEEKSIKAIRAAIDCGINLVDTAPAYGFGLSEEIVGKAIQGVREKVILATKCGLVWNKAKGDFHFRSDEKTVRKDSGDIRVYKYLAPASLREEIEASLKRLRTDYIDLYQTHWQDPTTPIAETMEQLLKLKKEGKIRMIGASNINTFQLEEYVRNGQLDTDQESYSMLDRKHEKGLMPACLKHNISFIAYSPLARGLLTGKITPERVFADGDQRKDAPLFSLANRSKIQDTLEKFKPIAERHSITVAQLVIAWTLHQKGCTHLLAGARSPQQAEENAKAGDIRLTDEETGKITSILSSAQI